MTKNDGKSNLNAVGKENIPSNNKDMEAKDQPENDVEEVVSRLDRFSCDKCTFNTIHKNGLLSHMGNVHSSKFKPFKCLQCEYASAKNRNLWKHMRRVHGKEAKPKKPKCGSCNKTPCKCKVSFSCSQCNYSAKQKLHLEGHVARVHEGTKMFMCDECGASFWRNSNLKKHVKDTHAEKNFSCDSCSYKTVHGRSLKYHIQHVHQGIKPYQCIYSECTFPGTATKTKLDEHLSLVHQHVYHCQSCEYNTRNRADLIKHNKLTHLKCSHCELFFDKKTHLTSHMIDIHPDIKPFECDHCSYATADPLLLKRHQKLTHANGKDPLSCPKCTFVTVRQDSLTKHIRYIHEGKEKPYKCSYPNCSTSTYTKAKLDTHIRRKHVEGRHHYKDELTSEWKKQLEDGHTLSVPKGIDLIDIRRTSNHELLEEDRTSDVTLEAKTTGYLELPSTTIEQNLRISEIDFGEMFEFSSLENHITLNAKDRNGLICDEEGDEHYNNLKNELREGRDVVKVATKPFSCHLCEYSGVTKRYLNKHMMTRHDKDTLLSNSLNKSCHQSPQSVEGNTVETKKLFKCNECSYSSDEKYLLARHSKNVHSGIKSFACSLCEFKTTYKYGLEKHINVVHKNYKPHRCTYPNCNFKGTANKANLDTHIKAVHLKVKDHICDICGYATVDKHTLKAHKKGVHDGIKDFICSFCGYATSYQKSLQRHIKIVHETKKVDPQLVIKDHICSSCGFATHSPQNLVDHFKRRHDSIYEKVCATCGFTTNTQANLNAHMRRKHEDQFAEPVKTLSCDMCTYVTNRIACLRQHKKATHERIKDKICTECEFETSYAGSLKNHMKEVHASDKVSVKCSVCSYSTNRRRNLTTHVMTVHYKIKPKSRNKCDKSELGIVTESGSDVYDIPRDDDSCINWEEASE